MKRLLVKRLLLVSVLFIFVYAGLPYKSYKLTDPLNTEYGAGKVLISENGVHVKRYGIRYSNDGEIRTEIGMYKIIIGDLDKLRDIYRLNRSVGFAGTVIFQMDNSTDWSIAKYRHYKYRGEAFEKRKLFEKIVKKKDLPNPFNIMPNYMSEIIESVAMYEDGKCVVICVLPETSLDDIGKLFGFVVTYKDTRSELT